MDANMPDQRENQDDARDESAHRPPLSAAEGHPQEPSPAWTLTPDEIFDKYAPRVYQLALRMLGNDSDAQDVTQDVFVQVISKLPTFRGESAFPTWLYRIAFNCALAFRRSRSARDGHIDHSRQGEGSRAPVHPGTPEPERLALDHEAHDMVDAAIARLPDAYRDVEVLADLEELPNTEIADVLGLSVAAVKSRLHRARLLLRDSLAPYFADAVQRQDGGAAQ